MSVNGSTHELAHLWYIVYVYRSTLKKIVSSLFDLISFWKHFIGMQLNRENVGSFKLKLERVTVNRALKYLQNFVVNQDDQFLSHRLGL